MTNYEFAPPPTISVPIEGGRYFPVRRIYCVGRNYAAHIREMEGDEREPPFFFQKPADAIVLSGDAVPYPSITQDLQFEIELVLALGKGGRNIDEADAHFHVFGLTAGVDLTRRDVQVAARKAGKPWEIGKAFDHSAPIGVLRPLGGAQLPSAGEISLAVNGQTKQKGDLSEMIWNCAEVIAQLSRQYALAPGDLIYTGTPAGVGSLQPGDEVKGWVENAGAVQFSIAG